eukprot:g24554.t1
MLARRKYATNPCQDPWGDEKVWTQLLDRVMCYAVVPWTELVGFAWFAAGPSEPVMPTKRPRSAIEACLAFGYLGYRSPRKKAGFGKI